LGQIAAGLAEGHAANAGLDGGFETLPEACFPGGLRLGGGLARPALAGRQDDLGALLGAEAHLLFDETAEVLVLGLLALASEALEAVVFRQRALGGAAQFRRAGVGLVEAKHPVGHLEGLLVFASLV